jgi:uncharacterized membrane protein YqjE
MMLRILSLAGSALVGLAVYVTVGTMTDSNQLAVFATGVCAFSLGIAAARDGIWRVDKRGRRE